MRRDVARVFEAMAPGWRDDPVRVERAALAVMRHLRPGGRVLDVGCGTGAVLSRTKSEAWWQHKRLGQTVGLDLAPAMANRTRRRRGVAGLVGDARSLPFVDHSFDVTVAADVLQFATDPVAATRELYRVTEPGGTVIIELAQVDLPSVRRAVDLGSLPARSLLRRFAGLRTSYPVAEIRSTLEDMGCRVQETVVRTRRDRRGAAFLARLARTSGTPADLEAARVLDRSRLVLTDQPTLLIARLPGPRTGKMPIKVRDLSDWTPQRVERCLEGLPRAVGYELVLTAQHWTERPKVQALCSFENRRITINVPTPFREFWEDVPYRAKRVRTRRRRMTFRWNWRRLTFRTPEELVRYLYLHEYYHWYLREVRGRAAQAETACDRFALQQLRRGSAARRRRVEPRASSTRTVAAAAR